MDEAFVPIRIEEAPALAAGLPDHGRPASARADAAAASDVGTIEIERGGLRIRLFGPVDAEPRRVSRRHFGLDQAALGTSFIVA